MAVEVLLARDIEKENLEAHVELCAERYRRLEEKLENVETKMSTVSNDLSGLHTSMSQDNKIIIKTLIATAGTIIVALVSAVAAVLTKMA
jgi:archaellum component FlaC